MTAIIPPTIDPVPTPAPQRNDRATFSDRVDAFISWLVGAVTQFAALASNVYTNATDAHSSAVGANTSAMDAASSAAAASASSAAVKWVSGTSYADGAVVWSPVDRYSYRRIGAGAGTMDPSADGANWALQLLQIGLGGAALTGNVALVTASPGAMTVTPAGPGRYVSLPDATTLILGAFRYSVYNDGDYDYGVKDYAGAVLGWVRAKSGAVLGLSSKATAAGAWVSSGLEKLGVTAIFNAPSISVDSTFFDRVALDATRTFLLFGSLNGGVYGAVYDSSSLSWGSAVLIRAAVSGVKAKAILAAANVVLAVSADNVTLNAVTLSVSGTALTVNTAATATAGAAVILYDQLIAVGASFAISYAQSGVAPGAFVQAITVSGTSCAIGAQGTLFTGNVAAARIFSAGSVLRAVVVNDTASQLRCYPFTVAGTTLTAGTSAALSSSTGSALRAIQLSSGDIVAVYTFTATMGAVFRLTGTVEVGTAIALLASTGAFSVGATELVATSSTKAIFVLLAAGLRANILTNSGGVASAGTELVIAASPTTLAAQAVLGSVARFLGASTGAATVLEFDCSGASPSLGNCSGLNPNVCRHGGTTASGGRSYQMLSAGDNVYSTGGGGNGAAWDGCFNTVETRLLKPINVAFAAGAPGAANETWGASDMAKLGASIRRVEAAA